jgi:hypothetical protein
MPDSSEVRQLKREIRDLKLNLLCARLHLADAYSLISMQPPPSASKFAHSSYEAVRDLCLEQIRQFEYNATKSFGSTQIMTANLIPTE